MSALTVYFPDKQTGDELFHDEVNNLRDAINQHAGLLDNPTAAAKLYQGLTRAQAVALLSSTPPQVVPGLLYGISASDWNGLNQPATVYVRGQSAGAFGLAGELLVGGLRSVVQVDVVAATARGQLGIVVDKQQALALAGTNRLQASTYVVLDYWNRIAGGVVLTPINVGAFGSIGYIYLSGRAIAVVADLYALTYELLDDYIAQRVSSGSQFLTGTYTIQPADLPEPHITVPNAALFANVGIAGAQGSLNQLAYGSGYTSAGNVLTILAATNAQAGEVVHYAYLAGAVSAPALGEQLAQHTTSDGLRGTGPFQFRNRRPSGLALTIISNVAMVAAQVNYRDTTRDGIWIPGQIYTSTGNSDAELADLLADVEADIAAVPAPALAIAAEVIFRTQPIDAKLESDFFLSGLRSGAFFGRASFFRTSYTGPPIGQVLNNPQFTDASGWDVPYGGATLGGGAANLFGRTTGDHLIEVRQSQTIQAGDYYFEIEIVQLDKGSVSLEIGQNGTIQKKWPLFAVGTYKYDVTLATSAQYDVYLHSFDAGIIISHVYLVPK